jgi:hypothetical protein
MLFALLDPRVSPDPTGLRRCYLEFPCGTGVPAAPVRANERAHCMASPTSTTGELIREPFLSS